MLLASFNNTAGKPLTGKELPPIIATASLRPKLANVPESTGANLAEIQKWLTEGDVEKIKGAWLSANGYDEATDNQKAQLEKDFTEAYMKYDAYSTAVKQLENDKKMVSLLETTEEENKILAEKNKDVDLFYCMGGLQKKRVVFCF